MMDIKEVNKLIEGNANQNVIDKILYGYKAPPSGLSNAEQMLIDDNDKLRARLQTMYEAKPKIICEVVGLYDDAVVIQVMNKNYFIVRRLDNLEIKVGDFVACENDTLFITAVVDKSQLKGVTISKKGYKKKNAKR